jgi:hypothetical protein
VLPCGHEDCSDLFGGYVLLDVVVDAEHVAASRLEGAYPLLDLLADVLDRAMVERGLRALWTSCANSFGSSLRLPNSPAPDCVRLPRFQ